MKHFIVILILTPLLSLSQTKTLSYAESSSGLNSPEWEGGDTELEFADMNNDGFVDFVTVGDHGNPGISSGEQGIMVYLNNGSGSWSVQMTGDLGYGGIAVGDVNNGGFQDVGYGIHHNYSSTDLGDQLLEVALGDGTNNNWTAWDDGLATNGEEWGMFGTDFADIDNDGDLDVGSISFGCCGGVHVYQNQMDGGWVQSFGFVGGNASDRFVFGDINNDGFTDFIVAHQNGAVYFGDGTGNFINADGNLPGTGSSGYFGTSLGDIDNDGDKDIAFVLNEIEVWGWDQENEEWIELSGNISGTSQFEETQLYDMNADGYIDLSAYGNGIFKLWLGDGTGNWAEETQFTTTGISDCKAFRAGGDIDHNGYPDMVLVAKGGSWPSYQNHLRCYKEASAADDLSIRGLFPKGNETFIQGSVQFIDWVSEVPSGESATVTIEFSFLGISGPWYLVADNLQNGGRFQWIVPNTGSEECYLKFTLASASDTVYSTTETPFTIIGDEVLYADFIADTTYGYVPLEVHFTDLSSGQANTWIWDLNGDGIFDSFVQNPVYTYEEAGSYNVQLIISSGSNADTMLKLNYINTVINSNFENDAGKDDQFLVFPNPFDRVLNISFTLSSEQPVSVDVLDLHNRLHKSILDDIPMVSGNKCILWDGKGTDGEMMKQGIYFIRLQTSDEIFIRKIIIK